MLHEFLTEKTPQSAARARAKVAERAEDLSRSFAQLDVRDLPGKGCVSYVDLPRLPAA